MIQFEYILPHSRGEKNTHNTVSSNRAHLIDRLQMCLQLFRFAIYAIHSKARMLSHCRGDSAVLCTGNFLIRNRM